MPSLQRSAWCKWESLKSGVKFYEENPPGQQPRSANELSIYWSVSGEKPDHNHDGLIDQGKKLLWWLREALKGLDRAMKWLDLLIHAKCHTSCCVEDKLLGKQQTPARQKTIWKTAYSSLHSPGSPFVGLPQYLVLDTQTLLHENRMWPEGNPSQRSIHRLANKVCSIYIRDSF